MNDYEKLARDILNLNKMDNDFSFIKNFNYENYMIDSDLSIEETKN